jgi:hypothetical protein
MLAAAVEEQKKAQAKKAQMQAIDKAKKEGAELFKKREGLEKQIKMLGELDKKYANDPNKLAQNTAAKAKLTVEFTALQQQIDKKQAAFDKLQDARMKQERIAQFEAEDGQMRDQKREAAR